MAADTLARGLGAAALQRISVPPAFSIIDAALDAGVSPAIQIIGDSTSDETNEFAYVLGQAFAQRRPNVHVRYMLWSDATQAYAAPIVINEGAGERSINFNGSAVRRLDAGEASAFTGNAEWVFRIAPTLWKPASDQYIAAHYGSAGSRSWRVGIKATTGFLTLDWSPDGTTILNATSTSAPNFANGAPGWVRVLLTVNAGASNRTISFFTSTDGATWTLLNTVTQTGTTSVNFAASRYLELGGAQGGSLFIGQIFNAQIRQGAEGAIINPQGIESWYVGSGDSDTNTLGGGPTLTIVNASRGGADYAYWSDATRFPIAVRPFRVGVVLVSMGLNSATSVGSVALKTSFDALAGLIDARLPTMAPIFITQNPKATGTVPPSATVYIGADQHARRQYMAMAIAARRGWEVIDTYRAFATDPRGLAALMEPDYGVHPNTTGGRALEAAVIAAAFARGAQP